MKTPGQVVPAQKRLLAIRCSWSAANWLYALISASDSGFTSLRSLRIDRRQVADADAAAGEGERVVDQHRETPLGQLVGPAHAAVIVLVMRASSSGGSGR